MTTEPEKTTCETCGCRNLNDSNRDISTDQTKYGDGPPKCFMLPYDNESHSKPTLVVDKIGGYSGAIQSVQSSARKVRNGRFRQTDATRVLRAAQKAGLRPNAIRIEPSGAITLMLHDNASSGLVERNPWDDELLP